RNTDPHVLLNLHLAGKPNFTLLLSPGQVAYCSRKHFSSPFFHYTSAFPAGATSTAGGRKEYFLSAQGIHQRGASGYHQGLLLVTVNDDFDIARSHKFGLSEK